MQGSTLVFSMTLGVVLLLGLWVMSLVRKGHTVELERLSKHKRRLQEKKPLEGEADDVFAQQRDDYLARILSQAGLEAKYDQMRMNWFVSAVGGAVLLAIGSMFVAPEMVPVAVILGLPAGAAGFVAYLRFLANQRQKKLTEQLPQVLENMVSALKAGSPVMETFKVLAETSPLPMRSEFKRALVSLQLGKSFREVMTEMGERIRTPDFQLLTQAIFISQDVGGNLADVVATIADQIRERFKLRDYMNSLTAQGKLTALFIGVLPWGITAITYIFSPGYITPFFNHPIARLVFIALAFWEMIGAYILIKMTTFEV